MVAEAFPAGLADSFDCSRPSLDGRLAGSAPRGPVLELPWDTETQGRGAYIYWSTRHWRPMVNGWGGFEPAGNLGLGTVGMRWPAPAAGECAGGACAT